MAASKSPDACGSLGCPGVPVWVVRLADGRTRTLCETHTEREIRKGGEVVERV